MLTVLGIMSGTSLDGVDIAACQFWQEKSTWKYTILHAETYHFTPTWQDKLKSAPLLSGFDLHLLNNELGRLLAQNAQDFISKNNLSINFIASHGHTVFHQPALKLTLQIGSGAEIAAQTGIDVINDFRVLDVALNGQGAPLVPIGDELLFNEYDACINLGGFANISANRQGNRIAWDIGPANIILNPFAEKLGLQYDKNGNIAQKGQIIPELLSYLNSLDFYQQIAPKSLGKEWVDEFIFTFLKDKNWPTEDILHTFTQHIAFIISKEINQINAQNVLFTGGGTYNSFLLQLIKKQTKAEIIVPNNDLINFKEALIFAFLGYLRHTNQINTLKDVTGAQKNSMGGAFWKG